MGGGGHGHEPPYKIPDYRIYKAEEIPALMATKRALAAKGLKDPWLRNEVWKYGKASYKEIGIRTFGRGVKYGLIAAVITTAIGYVIGDDDHGHGHGH